MDNRTLSGGIKYEALMLRAYQLEHSSVELGADKRIYYLLYFIQQGYDLRKTGYVKQFVKVKEHVRDALVQFLSMELHAYEISNIHRLLANLEDAHCTHSLDKIINNSLSATSRLENCMTYSEAS